MFALATVARAQVSTIVIGDQPLRTGVQRFGINLSGQTYYDSGQMLRNLVARNPGFEGETWQSILRCKQVTRNTCTDENPYAVWPEGFLAGAQIEVISGSASGERGKVVASSAARDGHGVTLTMTGLAKPLGAGDFVLVRMEKPGGTDAGWWTSVHGGATLATERKDLSPRTPGRQALRIDASKPGASAAVASYFDTLAGHSFVRLHGVYVLRFRAKPLTERVRFGVRLERLDTTHGLATFLNRTIELKPGWNDYALEIPANDAAHAAGNVALTFELREAAALLDDVELSSAARPPANPTAFRDEVVAALRELHPGVLRYMDNGPSFGSSLDNLLAPQFARERAGASTQQTTQEDVAIGLAEFLTLCEAVHADPWITLPAGFSPSEAARLIEYLSGPATTAYGGRRAAGGHARPWTASFGTIHLELGNEQWNARSFAGAAINDPKAYAQRAAEVFHAARTSPYFDRARFDLVMGSWLAVPWWTEQELAAAGGAADTVAVAPYLFSEFNSAPNIEGTFGPMFAQPEAMDSRDAGLMQQQARAARTAAHPARLAVYETNLGTAAGSVPQSAIDVTVPSLGAGLAVADHILLMLRDAGVTTQSLFALPEYRNDFVSSTGAKETTPLWGAVVDMGGATERRRPSFLALAMINRAILPTVLPTRIEGASPTWNQPLSPNDKIALDGAHELQSFAFADGPHRSLIVFNLSRDHARSIATRSRAAPAGSVRIEMLTAAHITDSNEQRDLVHPAARTEAHFNLAAPYLLPPFSMTVFSWTAAR